LWLWADRAPDVQPWTDFDGHQRRIDAWGGVWERVNEETFGEAKSWPVDITRQADYAFPKYCLGVPGFCSLNEGTHNIMGLANMFFAYYDHPIELKALIGRLAEQQRQAIHLLAEYGCDGVMGYDDWGLQNRLMVNPVLIEEFFMPHYRANWRLAHELGMDVWLHSCGYIIDILPMLIEAGLDVIKMDQQENMGLENLNNRVGGKIAFWCPVDIQKTMIEGSIKDINAYGKQLVGTLGSHQGGFISMAYSSPEAVHHTPEKVAAMCAAFRTYGV
jgi:uroporphyrinogen-III decarboxylase